MDTVNKEKRSWMMSRVKSKDTKPEKIVRSMIHRMGFRFRKNRRDLPGSPDIVFPKYRKVIFIHGCFWHGHKNCSKASRPSSNEEFWSDKLDTNIQRDRKKVRELKKQGWKVLIIWECQIKDEKRLTRKIKRFLVDNERNLHD